MSEESTGTFSPERRDRRVRVRLAVEVRGTDSTGMRFDERTMSEDLCRSGVAFHLSRALEVGSDLEIGIPLPRQGRQDESDFATQGRVRHIEPRESGHIVGVEFTGPRFHRLFVSESVSEG